MDLVFLFPGQGSQAVGMGRDFFDSYSSVRDLFAEASDIAGLDLETLCFEGPADVLVRTENVQPAITVVNLAVLTVLREEGFAATATAGHSLGEYAALHAAGTLSRLDTMRAVSVRGQAMQAAAEENPGGMIAVFGLDVSALSQICEQVGPTGSAEIANHNSAGQVALTGEADAIDLAARLAKEAGAKLVIPLKVSGPWHSRFMVAAQAPLQTLLEGCALAQPSMPVIANVTARPYEADEIVDLLLQQVVSPVRWAQSMERLIADGNRRFVEVGPGRVLSGLFRDIDREVEAYSVRDLATLEAFRDAVGSA